MKNGHRWRTAVFSLLGVFLLLLLLANTQIAMDGVRKGLTLCTETLIPSLFPFLVLSELLIAAGAGAILGRFLSRPVGALFGLSAQGSVSLMLGTLCGFPVATTTAVAFFERGKISKKELERLVLFANNPSSGFLIGAVGKALFGSTAVGIALFCITLLSCALLGGVLGFLIYNHHPAKMFMGDTGSLFIGGLLMGCSMMMGELLVFVIAGLMFVIEMLSSLLQITYFKLSGGKRIFKMAPLHHHFEMCGWSEVKLVVIFTAVSAVFCVLAAIGVVNRFVF